MLEIDPTAKVSHLADIEPSARGTLIRIGARTMIDSFVKIKPAGGSGEVWVIWVEEVAKNGRIRRRICPNATVLSIKQDKSERGTPNGYEVTLKIDRHASVGGEHFGEWLITPPAG